MRNLLFGALTLTICVAVFIQTRARRAEIDVKIQEMLVRTDRVEAARFLNRPRPELAAYEHVIFEQWQDRTAHQYHTARAFSETTSSLAATYDLAYLNDQTSASAQDDGPGYCYRDDVDIPEEEREKNDWQTPCACTKITACDPKNGESPTCKRHCKKSQCDCCAV